MTESKTKPTRHTAIRITIILFLICLIGLVFLGAHAIRQQVRSFAGEPDPGLGSNQVLYYEVTFFLNQGNILQSNSAKPESIFQIDEGEKLDDVISGLKQQGIISDRTLFRNLLIYSGADRRILPGKYVIAAGSSLRDVAAILQDSNSSLVDFVILPGWRKEEIAEALPTSGLSISMEEFLTKVNQPLGDVELAGSETVSHEGFLSPGRYSFRRDVTVDEFVSAFLDHFRQTITPDMRKANSGFGLTTYQAVILASIIQREAVIETEKPLIASVFLNRLKLGMPLQSDPTVQYSLGFNPEWGWWKSPLSLEDLQINSTYNTYMINGLPPAPISNPDDTSLKAVAFPEESTYLYFRATCDGSGKHVFSETIEEHTMNGCF
jgi:UPF0755 protein